MTDQFVFRIPFTNHVVSFTTNLAVDAIALTNLFSRIF